MRIREPIAVGDYYPAEADRCRAHVESLVVGGPGEQPGRFLYGALVPCTRWAQCGTAAIEVLAALADARSPDVLVIFGSVSGRRGRQAAMFADGRWETPLGPVTVDGRLAERVLGQTNLILDDPYAHEDESSIEVLTPFIAHLFANKKMLPIAVPSVPQAAEVGEAVARTLLAYDYDAIVLGAMEWTYKDILADQVLEGMNAGSARSKGKHRRRFIDLICELRSAELVSAAQRRDHAVSAGAVAATVAAAAKLGASHGSFLRPVSDLAGQGAMVSGADRAATYAGLVFA